MPMIEIFKPVANAKSMEGVGVTLTAQDLQAIAANYDTAVHEAPLTIGHPTHDAPAYGWAKALSFSDGALWADAEQSEQLQGLVAQGHYKKVSASFYRPDAPSNPTPGKWALRHIGFLGAQPPGIKGLKAVSFADGEAGVVTFGELPGYAGSMIARLFGQLRDWLIVKEGQEAADRVISSYQVEGLREMSQRADEAIDPDSANPFSGGTPALSFSEPGKAATLSATGTLKETPPMKTVEQLQAELDAANAANASLRTAEAARIAADATAQATARHASHVSFCEGLVTAAKWPAAAKDVLVQALDVIATPSDAGVVSFGEGDAAKPLASVLQEHLQALPASVSFGEFAGKGSGGGKALSNQDVAARANAYQARRSAAGQAISLSQAVDAVNSGADKD